MTLYERIRKLRIDSDMTQDELAKAMGYKDRSMITKIESGKVDISQKKVESFAKVLHTTPAFLMGWTEDPSESEPHRVIPIVVPDSARFVELTKYMPVKTFKMVMEAFDKAEKLLEEAERKKAEAEGAKE